MEKQSLHQWLKQLHPNCEVFVRRDGDRVVTRIYPKRLFKDACIDLYKQIEIEMQKELEG